jgi:hypothetical protein
MEDDVHEARVIRQLHSGSGVHRHPPKIYYHIENLPDRVPPSQNYLVELREVRLDKNHDIHYLMDWIGEGT